MSHEHLIPAQYCLVHAHGQVLQRRGKPWPKGTHQYTTVYQWIFKNSNHIPQSICTAKVLPPLSDVFKCDKPFGDTLLRISFCYPIHQGVEAVNEMITYGDAVSFCDDLHQRTKVKSLRVDCFCHGPPLRTLKACRGLGGKVQHNTH